MSLENGPKYLGHSSPYQMLSEDLALLPHIYTRVLLLPTLLDNSETCFRTVWPMNAIEAHAVVVVVQE